MKLYTEEQMSVAINAAKANPEQAYLIQAMLTPVELPSDEEIESKAEDYTDKFVATTLFAFEDGAKWMRDKIQGGKK